MNFGCLLARNILPEIAGLAHYAQELAGDAPLPRRSLFNPADIAAIADYVYMVEVLREENDYLFGYSGARMQALCGADLGGMRLSEVGDPALRRSQRETYDHVVEAGQPLYMRGYYVWSQKSVPIERLLIPMTTDDGVLNAICGMSIPEVAHIDLEKYTGSGPARLVREDELMRWAG